MIGFFLISLANLFSVVNPLGTMPMFVGITNGMEKQERNRIAFKSSLYAVIILLISFFLGRFILLFFGISIDALRIAGGLIIASSGFALLTGNFVKHKGVDKRVKDDAFNKEDPSMTPLSIPMLAGPGSISLLITWYEEYQELHHIFLISSVVLAVGILTWIILRSSQVLVNRLGASGINAISRIIGFIVISIGVEYIIISYKDIMA